jgi:hypothetical protein
MRMALVALLGFGPAVIPRLWEALADAEHEAMVVPLDPESVPALGRLAPDALVLDAHVYVDTRALLDDLRRYPPTQALPVVLLGPARPTQVPDYPGVWRLRPCFELASLLATIAQAVRARGVGAT